MDKIVFISVENLKKVNTWVDKKKSRDYACKKGKCHNQNYTSQELPVFFRCS